MILYDGPSLFDGKPVVLVTRPGHNEKIGEMLATWILVKDEPPHVAAFDGADSSICGDCKFRANTKGRACYVRTHLEPRTVWEAWQRGKYAAGSPRDAGRGQVIRIGSYGDPAAVPAEIWEEMVSEARRWTAYTHAWRTCDPRLRRICMASVDTPAERDEARGMGWRTYHVVPRGTTYKPVNEILCPASKEAGRKTTCAKCRLCMGYGIACTKDIWIPAHGPGAELVMYEV
jgi:hypothetical protein